jgi:hypothetical protein
LVALQSDRSTASRLDDYQLIAAYSTLSHAQIPTATILRELEQAQIGFGKAVLFRDSKAGAVDGSPRFADNTLVEAACLLARLCPSADITLMLSSDSPGAVQRRRTIWMPSLQGGRSTACRFRWIGTAAR